MTATQTIQPETPAAPAPAAAIVEAPAATADEARTQLKTPETVQPAVIAETPAADGSIMPKEPQKLPEIKPAENPPAVAPTSLTEITAAIEANAAKKAAGLIAQANAAGANIQTEGLAVTVKIDGSPLAATTTAEAHACTADCNHASPAKAEASPAQLLTAAAEAPVAQNAAAPAAAPATEAAVAAPAQPQADAPTVEQPIGEVQPAGLAATPVTQVTAPATHKGIAANNDKFAIGA